MPVKGYWSYLWEIVENSKLIRLKIESSKKANWKKVHHLNFANQMRIDYLESANQIRSIIWALQTG